MADKPFIKYGNVKCPECLYTKSAILHLPKPGSKKPATLTVAHHVNRAQQICPMSGQPFTGEWPEWTKKFL